MVYPQFRTFYTNFFVNEAHNDYLQLLVEMGLLGFGTMLWFLLTLYTPGHQEDRELDQRDQRRQSLWPACSA